MSILFEKLKYVYYWLPVNHRQLYLALSFVAAVLVGLHSHITEYPGIILILFLSSSLMASSYLLVKTQLSLTNIIIVGIILLAVFMQALACIYLGAWLLLVFIIAAPVLYIHKLVYLD